MNDDSLPLPYVAFGNDELEACDKIAAGNKVTCDKCGKKHVVTEAGDGLLQFVKCRGKSFLVGVSGRNVMHRFSKKGV